MKPKKDFSTASLAVIGVDIGKEVFHIVVVLEQVGDLSGGHCRDDLF